MSRLENGHVAAEKTRGMRFKERTMDIYSVESQFVYDKRSFEGESKGAAVNNENSGMRL